MRIGRLATLAVFVAAWLVGATLLWQTSVPHLDLGHAPTTRWFDSSAIDRAKSYARFQYILWALRVVAVVIALAVLTVRAPRMARSIGLGPIGTGVIVAMVMLVTLFFVSLPFGFLSQWWDIRHGLAPHDYISWLVLPWAQLTFEAIYALVVVAIVMGLARKLGPRWWVAGAPVFAVLAASFGFLAGYVAVIGTHPVHSRGLRSAIHTLERREGVSGTPVRVQKVSDATKEANAFSIGFGPSARVVLWDTLLDKRFRGQVRFVLAHELGHVAHRHVLKGLGWFALFALPLAWFVTAATRRRGGLANPASLPLALLALTLANLAVAPVVNAVSRRYEAEADWSALQATRDPRGGTALFRKFQRTSLQDPSPPHLAFLWFANHPTLLQRLEMIEAWRRRSGGRGYVSVSSTDAVAAAGEGDSGGTERFPLAPHRGFPAVRRETSRPRAAALRAGS